MPNTYLWSVNKMTAYPQYEGEDDVVFQATWVCSATDGTYNAAVSDIVSLTYVAGTPFTPYEDLTLDQVLGWVFAALGTNGIEQAQADCDIQITAQLNASTVTPPLPWEIQT